MPVVTGTVRSPNSFNGLPYDLYGEPYQGRHR